MDKWRKRWNVLLFYALVVGLFLLGTLLGNRTVAVISEMVPVERLHCIVIDPGHGGEDGGAVSCSGRNESVFNLQIGLRLNDLLHFLGYDTVMIRTTDTAVYTSGDTIAQRKVSDLKQRVRIVNRTNHAVLISIHQNTFPEGKNSGAQVFYSGTAGQSGFHTESRQPPKSQRGEWHLPFGKDRCPRYPGRMRFPVQLAGGGKAGNAGIPAPALLRDFRICCAIPCVFLTQMI